MGRVRVGAARFVIWVLWRISRKRDVSSKRWTSTASAAAEEYACPPKTMGPDDERYYMAIGLSGTRCQSGGKVSVL